MRFYYYAISKNFYFTTELPVNNVGALIGRGFQRIECCKNMECLQYKISQPPMCTMSKMYNTGAVAFPGLVKVFS